MYGPAFYRTGGTFFIGATIATPTIHRRYLSLRSTGKTESRYSRVLLTFTTLPPGYLLFARDTTVMAQPFDASSLQFTGDPVAVVENVGFITSVGRSLFSVSENGTLVYKTGGGVGTAVEMVRPAGKRDLEGRPAGRISVTWFFRLTVKKRPRRVSMTAIVIFG